MTPNKKKVLAILGSTKTNSSNEAILKYIGSRYEEDIELELFDGIDKLPHFNPDLDNENPPQIIKELRDKIKSSEGIIICTPEYVFSLPGSLKNALEWTVSTTVFAEKPTAIIIASASGEKALESLDLIMKTIGAKITEESKLLIQGVKGKVDALGNINNIDTIQDLDKLTTALIKIIDKSIHL